VPHVPPDFLWSLVALANFMRLSSLKAAHANLADAGCRKSGSPKRTWAENDFFQCFHSRVIHIIVKDPETPSQIRSRKLNLLHPIREETQ